MLSLSLILQVTDLHRHKIDHITIPSSRGPTFGVLRRVEDVRTLDLGLEYFLFLGLHFLLLFLIVSSITVGFAFYFHK